MVGGTDGKVLVASEGTHQSHVSKCQSQWWRVEGLVVEACQDVGFVQASLYAQAHHGVLVEGRKIPRSLDGKNGQNYCYA